eukprot:1754447-Prymnesium_polylepis.1
MQACGTRRPGSDRAVTAGGRDGVTPVQNPLDDKRLRHVRVAGHDREHAGAAHQPGGSLFHRE